MLSNGLHRFVFASGAVLRLFVGPHTPFPSMSTASNFWGSNQSDSTTVEEIAPSIPAMMYNRANSAIDRQQRLSLVMHSLLRLQEQDKLLMRPQSIVARDMGIESVVSTPRWSDPGTWGSGY